MRLKNVLITVKDMEKSKAFYKELFGLDVILDNDGKAILTEGLVLQDENIWKEVVGADVILRNNASSCILKRQILRALRRSWMRTRSRFSM